MAQARLLERMTKDDEPKFHPPRFLANLFRPLVEVQQREEIVTPQVQASPIITSAPTAVANTKINNDNSNNKIGDDWFEDWFQDMYSSLDYPHLIAFVFGLWMAVSFWKVTSKNLRKRRRRNNTGNAANKNSTTKATSSAAHTSGTMTQEQYQTRMEQQREEYDSLVSALREELHEKTTLESEQAILWRQEKNILRARIEEQHTSSMSQSSSSAHGVATTSVSSTAGATGGLQEEILTKVNGLEETVASLTNLSESQRQGIQAKQNEIEKLQNIMAEMSESMEFNTGGSSRALKRGSSSRRTSNKGGATKKKQNRPSHVQIVPDTVQRELQEQLSLRFSHHNDHEDGTEEDTADDEEEKISDEEDSVLSEEEEEPAPTASRLQGDNKIVLLTSSMPGNLQVSAHQSRIETIFRHGLHLTDNELEIVDGCDAEILSLRNDLFQISGLHAVYPQVFLVAEGDIQFVGDFDSVVEMHDSRVLPDRIGLILPEDYEINYDDTSRGTRSSVAEQSESSTLTNMQIMAGKHNAGSPSSRQTMASGTTILSPASPE